MKKIITLIALLSLAACQQSNYVPETNYSPIAPAFEPDYALDRFESTIKNYEKQDLTQIPVGGGIVLIGSSSFYYWSSAEKDLSPLPIINRGFGGSTLPELSYYVERMIVKYNPKTVVVYCENDLYGSKVKTPAQVRDAYVRLTQQIRSKLSTVQIYFVSIKPSPSRWSQWKDATQANNLIQDFIKTDTKHGYIDVSATMIKNGRPDGTIFLQDSLHMNLEGYRRWTGVIKPVLMK